MSELANIAMKTAMETSAMLWDLKSRLESLEAQQVQTSEPSSSEDTEMAEETPRTWSTSFKSLFPVSPDGELRLSARQAISDWLNSQEIPGGWQEVEIGVTLTSKDSTPPAGSPLPSTEEQSQGASGAAGNHNELCGNVSKNRHLVCTREAGHDGDHTAYDNEPELRYWKQGTDKADPDSPAESPARVGSEGRKAYFGRVVSHIAAEQALSRFITGHFGKRGLFQGPRFSIPVQPDDDDMVLGDYIAQQASVAPSPDWRGLAERAEELVGRLPASDRAAPGAGRWLDDLSSARSQEAGE